MVSERQSLLCEQEVRCLLGGGGEAWSCCKGRSSDDGKLLSLSPCGCTHTACHTPACRRSLLSYRK
jgi:hypothetical protein